MHLLFHMNLRPSGSLLKGRLLLMDGHRLKQRYIATSGAPQWQQWQDQGARGKGPIPRCDQVGLPEYTVCTTRHTSDIPGISGGCYDILPVTLPALKCGTARSHFLIHYDANAPGSAGCIVLTTEGGWAHFEGQMAELREGGIDQLPLQVDYSY